MCSSDLSYYTLADPHFFTENLHDNVKKMWENISRVDWNMIIFVPYKISFKGEWIRLVRPNVNLRIVRYNTTPVEGFNWVENIFYKIGLGMPRPRNVLIPSIMLGLDMHFKNIYIAGADHSWTRTLSVDDDNHVVSIQPHFYKENEKEEKRVKTEYMNHKLHDIMYSFYVAFRSYHTIERFTKHIGANIWNITPDSFIDAFPRKKL